jgi:hypothetical protein
LFFWVGAHIFAQANPGHDPSTYTPPPHCWDYRAYTTKPRLFVEIGSHFFLPGLASKHNDLISVSWIARITDVSLNLFFLLKKLRSIHFLSSRFQTNSI